MSATSELETSGGSKSKRSKNYARNLLPDPGSHTTSKSLCKTMKEAFTYLKELNLLDPDFQRVNSKLNEDEKVCWIIHQFGWSTLSTIGSILNSLPAALTHSQRLSFLQSECTSHHIQLNAEVLDSLAEFLEEECSSFLSSLPKELLVLCPPLSECPSCDSRLVSYHQCSVMLYSLNGVKMVPKVTLRCKQCKLFFGYSKFGNKEHLGFRFYSDMQPYVEVSDTILVERNLLEFQCSLA